MKRIWRGMMMSLMLYLWGKYIGDDFWIDCPKCQLKLSEKLKDFLEDSK